MGRDWGSNHLALEKLAELPGFDESDEIEINVTLGARRSAHTFKSQMAAV
jgi:hypothetical protein